MRRRYIEMVQTNERWNVVINVIRRRDIEMVQANE